MKRAALLVFFACIFGVGRASSCELSRRDLAALATAKKPLGEAQAKQLALQDPDLCATRQAINEVLDKPDPYLNQRKPAPLPPIFSEIKRYFKYLGKDEVKRLGDMKRTWLAWRIANS